MKDFLSETYKPIAVKLLYQGKEAGVLNIEAKFEIGAKPPPEMEKPKKGQLPRPQPAAIGPNDDVLNFTLKSAELLKDGDFFTKMDPQCEIEFVGLPPQKGPLLYRSAPH